MTDQTARIGILYPFHSAEDDYPRMAPMVCPEVRMEVVHTTIAEDAHREDACLATGDVKRLLEGARNLAPKKVDAAMWACTSGSFVYGLEGARDQVRPVADFLGVPVSSTSLAFVSALHFLGIRRVAVAASYPRDVTLLLKQFLSDAGVRTVHLDCLGIVTGVEVALLNKEQVTHLVLSNDHTDAEAIVVPDTAMHSAGWVADLETAVGGKPVLTANQVTLWQALQLVDGGPFHVDDSMGSLFSAGTARPASSSGGE
jgi:maleate cis-trans isomerase